MLGMGPRETEFRIVAAARDMRLRAYPGNKAGPVLLIVPAPIKKPYIWDLTPQTSVVRRCIEGGVRVFLVQWEPASQADLGLADYIGDLIRRCLELTRAETGEPKIFITGHSLGGTLAAITAALHNQWIKGLVLVGAPVHFGRGVGSIDEVVARLPDTRLTVGSLKDIPGSLLSMNAFLTDPFTFGWSRWTDYLSSIMDAPAMETHLHVERWTYDEVPLPRHLIVDVVESLYRRDRFMRGELFINDRRANPEDITAPLLSIVDPRCRVVPRAAVLPFHRAVASTDKKVVWYRGDVGVSMQHVGMLVGRHAHEDIWPRVLHWMWTRWEAAVGRRNANTARDDPGQSPGPS